MPADELAGRRKIAEGREAIIYEWDDGLVARVMWSADEESVTRRSAAASEAARQAGVATPRIVDIMTIDGLPAQIMDRVHGVDLSNGWRPTRSAFALSPRSWSTCTSNSTRRPPRRTSRRAMSCSGR